MSDVGAVASLLSEIFGFLVNAGGLAKMKRERFGEANGMRS